MSALMALQTCSRCRKKRIKCDILLPACANCHQAEVECVFHDDSLQQEIPRSYLHALQKKTFELEAEIQSMKDDANISSCGRVFSIELFSDLGFHLGNFDENINISRTVYLGPGSAARLLDLLLRGCVDWHTKNKSIDPTYSLSPLILLSAAIDDDSDHPFGLNIESPSCDRLRSVPVSAQRALIEHYLKVVHSKYPLLKKRLESVLQDLENPIEWLINNPGNEDSLDLTAIFAISSALVSRDLDPNFSGISSAFRLSFSLLVEESEISLTESTQILKQNTRSLCFLAIMELVNPTFCNLWEIVGRALDNIEQLRTDLHTKSFTIDEDLRRLELSLLKIESSLALHFRRPSPMCEIRQALDPNGGLFPQSAADPHAIYDCLLKISRGFTITPRPSQATFEELIPSELKVSAGDVYISPSSATLYLALHPLFTSYMPDIFSSEASSDSSLSLLRIVAHSASTVIDGFVRLNQEHKIISIWRSTERVLQAGAVWATYVIKFRLMGSPNGQTTQMRQSSAMGPLLKCNTLLTSFTQRWKTGLIYAQIWETFLQLMWGILE